jgi:carbon starvation protein
VTLTASYQKVFSSNPKIGFFEQRSQFQAAIDAGKVLPPAKTPADMHAVVTNSTVDGILSALFAAMIIVVILDAARIWVKAIRAREPLPSTEAPHVPSRILAPAGLFPTADERALLATASNGGAPRFAREDERVTTRTGGEP